MESEMDLNKSGPFLRHLLGKRNLAEAVPDVVNFSESQRSLLRVS